MRALFKTTRDIFSIQALRRRLLYTAFFAIIYRFGTYVLLPWWDPSKFIELRASKQESPLDRLLATTLDSGSIFSLGIGTYITASIIMQLASFAIPYLQSLQKEGQAGRSRINQITRLITIPLAILQGIWNLYRLKKPGEAITGIETNILEEAERSRILPIGNEHSILFYITSIFLLLAGAIFSIWLADMITEKGLGSGPSVLIMVNIVAKLAGALQEEISSPAKTIPLFILEVILFFAIVLSIIAFTQAARKITLQYARPSGSGYGITRGRQYLPIKLNITGVMPVIFASLFILAVKATFSFLHNKLGFGIAGSIAKALENPFNWQYNLLLAILIFGSTFIYAAVFVNPVSIANELKQNNAFISGIKPGLPTANHIDRIVSRIIFPGSLFLAFIAIIPAIIHASSVGIGERLTYFYGGTNLLILVGVLIEMSDQVRGHLHMFYYDRMAETKDTIPKYRP